MTVWKPAALASAIVLAGSIAQAEPAKTRLFAETWIDGAHGAEPQMQVQQVDADTFVIRQSVETNIEAPFLYLFFGKDRALLLDTGAGGLKIRPTIDGVIAKWLAAKGKTSIPLVVAHTHAHGDHIAGDVEFAGDPNVTVVGHKPENVAAFFGIKMWPTEIVPFDLGGRVLTIIPSPGHEPAEITVYDPETKFLQMGDELYPGRLYVAGDDFTTYRDTIDRVVAFTRAHPVSWVMGNHIEMTTTPRRDFPMHAPSHPNEHPLELPYACLLELQASVHKMTGAQLDVHRDFIFYPTPM
jgi:glyoxylase-like metal-dependent hydrolase (beta-lactamase superfamily II)